MTIIPRRPPPEAAKPSLPARVGHAAAGVAKGLLASVAEDADPELGLAVGLAGKLFGEKPRLPPGAPRRR
jgi:hypothetical protein